MYAPYFYDSISLAENFEIPSNVQAFDNKAFRFWERAFYQRALSVIKETLPDEWSGKVKDVFNFILFKNGYLAVFDDVMHGLTFQPANLYGHNWYYLPTNAIVVNPYDNYNKDLIIGKDCEILTLTPDYMGIWDIITYYAIKMSLLDCSTNQAIINSKFGHIIGSRNKSAGQAIKKILDKINRGEPAVVYDMNLTNDKVDKDAEPWQFLDFGNLKQKYITSDMLMDAQTIINAFDAEIGIATVPYQKKERMVTSEAESKETDSTARLTVWIDSLNESAKVINDHYGTNLHFEKVEKPVESGVVEDGNNVNGDV